MRVELLVASMSHSGTRINGEWLLTSPYRMNVLFTVSGLPCGCWLLAVDALLGTLKTPATTHPPTTTRNAWVSLLLCLMSLDGKWKLRKAASYVSLHSMVVRIISSCSVLACRVGRSCRPREQPAIQPTTRAHPPSGSVLSLLCNKTREEQFIIVSIPFKFTIVYSVELLYNNSSSQPATAAAA